MDKEEIYTSVNSQWVKSLAQDANEVRELEILWGFSMNEQHVQIGIQSPHIIIHFVHRLYGCKVLNRGTTQKHIPNVKQLLSNLKMITSDSFNCSLAIHKVGSLGH